MKWIPETVGAEPRKLAILGGLLAVAGFTYWYSSSSDAGPEVAPSTAAASKAAASKVVAQRESVARQLTANANARASRRGEPVMQDFRPTLKLPEDTDVSRIDPSLKLELLAKLNNLSLEGGGRSVFAFGAAPAPKAAPPRGQPAKPIPAVGPTTPPPPVAPPPPPSAPVKPPPPPIPLRFYGYSTGTPRRAFFIEGEDIYVAGENETVHGRYRIIKIDANSALVEDTASKSQQTLPLVAELPG